MKKAILLVLSVILLLSGCSNSDIQISKTNIANDVTLNTNTITNTSYANPAFHNVNKLPSTFENQKAINNPADMLWSDKTIERYFFVRLKSEDNFYLATNKVYNAFISSLNWTVEYTPAKGELIDYDYILRASDSYNIYFNSKTNIFYFEDSDKYYKLWSQKSNFWNNLRFDKNNAIVDLSDNELILDSQSEKEDIDGDLIPESIYLRTEKNISDFGNDTNLYLMIN